MTRTKTFFLIIFMLLLKSGFGQDVKQDKGFTFLLGPSVNYFYGDTKETASYVNEHLGWQLNGQFGYISTRGGTTRGNMLAVFGSAGSTQPEAIAIMKEGNPDIPGELNIGKKFNEFYSVEAGMVIARFLRISGVIGRQAYTYDTNSNDTENYFNGQSG